MRPAERVGSVPVIVVLAILTLSAVPSMGAGLARAGPPPASGHRTGPVRPGPEGPVGPTIGPPPAIAAVSNAPPPVHVHLGPFDPGVPRPVGWAKGAPPPGAPLPANALLPSADPTPPALGHINATWNNSVCAGVWPSAGWWPGGGQGLYAPGCYGHDEPAIEFYSSLPGSGGNVTWNVTLPVDRSPSATQSQLYVAIWFGLTLSDPFGWLHQCFLELQFYPDSTYGSGNSYDHWVGAAVAWQIEAATGSENACFYAPLALSGGGSGQYLNMAGGDAITVTMTGWAGDPTGEVVTVQDHTNGNASNVTLYDATDGVPFDPAFATNAYDNSLLWTPGGEFPVSFAFETGHTSGGGYPDNNSYGGCSPGVPPSTSTDPAVPCPSYDPASWENDTLAPWRIDPPTFFNATRSMIPAQVGFGQPEGGVRFVDGLSGGTCDGRDGSAWCSYPWYSYSCANRAFQFGALDYPGTSEDFGALDQYGSLAVRDGVGFGYYAPDNYTMPACGAPTAQLTLATQGPGIVSFLSASAPANRTVDGILPGNYSLSAVPRPGDLFEGWTTSGHVTLSTPASDPWANLVVQGNGSITAAFGSGGNRTTVGFATGGNASGRALVVGRSTDGPASGLAAWFANGSTARLPTGIYSLQALPSPGTTFEEWTVGAGLVVASPTSVFTTLLVTGTASNARLTAAFSPDNATATVSYQIGSSTGGTITVNGTTTTLSGSQTLRVGTYPLRANASAGYSFLGWYVGGVGEVELPTSVQTNVTVEGASVSLYAYFYPKVSFVVAPSGSGRIRVDGAGTFPNATARRLAPGQWAVVAEPRSGETFVGWTSSDPLALWVLRPNATATDIEVNASATLTVRFASAPAARLVLDVAPVSAGSIVFDGGSPVPSGTVNTTLTNGSYPVSAIGRPGYLFTGWGTSGAVSVVSGPAGTLAVVTGTNGTLTANFSIVPLPVTFVSAGAPGAVARIDGTLLASDATVLLAPGAYPISVVLPASVDQFVGWDGTPGLSVAAGTLTVVRAGTIDALVAPFTAEAPVASPTELLRNATVTLTAAGNGTGPFEYVWQDLPGCPAPPSGLPTLVCRATVSGTFPVFVEVIDPDGMVAPSPTVQVAVDAPVLRAGIRATPNATDVGAVIGVSATLQNGFAPFSFRYQGLPPGCYGGNFSSFVCVPDGPSSGSSVTITDAVGLSATFPIDLVVHALPSVAASGPTPWTTDLGVPQNLSVLVRHGTAPFTYTWSGLPSGCAGTDGPMVSCAPTVAGNQSVQVSIVDAVGNGASVTVPFVVRPPPTLAFDRPFPPASDRGVPLNLSVRVTGGLAPYAISYRGLPTGCPPPVGGDLVCVPTVTGTTPFEVVAVDRLGLVATLGAEWNVTDPPAIAAFTVAPLQIHLGEGIDVHVVASGGSSPLTYRYTGLPPGCGPFPGPGGSCVPTATGNYTLNVTVSDSSGVVRNATTSVLVTARPAAPVPTTEILLIVLVALGTVTGIALWVRTRRRRGNVGETERLG